MTTTKNNTSRRNEGTAYNAEGRKVKVSIPTRDEDLANDNLPDTEFYNFLFDFYKQMMAVMKSGASYYIFHADSEGYSDNENPDYLFSTTFTSLLTKIAHGDIDAEFYARRELANRGLDLNGNWIGFKAAAKEHKI